MLQLIIEDVKKLTDLLFVQETFDRFLMSEAHFVTGITVDLDGSLNSDYYDTDELSALSDHRTVAWGAMKKLCFQIIKGRKLPKRFRIVLKLAEADILTWLTKNGLSTASDAVKGLFITFRYENQQLSCTSGTALSVFTLDKTLEQAWDAQIVRMLKAIDVAAREA